MRRYALDTNLYIAASRDRSSAEQLQQFYAAALDTTYLHRAPSLQGARAVRNAVAQPFASRRRPLAPAFVDFVRSCDVVGSLMRDSHISRDHYSRSFSNDPPLTVCCRAARLTLVTQNLTDSERIRRVLDFGLVPPWPEV